MKPGVLRLLAVPVLAAAVVSCRASPAALESGLPESLPQDPAFFRRAMQDLVQDMGAYARSSRPGFLVVPQNGLGLLTDDGTPEGSIVEGYAATIDGVGQEEVFYGYPRDDRPTPSEETAYLLRFLRRVRRMEKTVLIIDYCRRPEAVADSYRRSAAEGFVAFAAPRRELDAIPSPSHPTPEPNGAEILELNKAANFLYLINPGRFGSVQAFVDATAGTPYDLLVVDAFGENDGGGSRWLSAAEVRALQRKPSGARRIVLAYFSIGEAESYRYYWRREWDRFSDGTPDRNAPAWLERENPNWQGNYKVRYWDPRWQAILYGNADSYLDGILARGYDGVYLDLVDAYLYFEEQVSTIQD